MRVPTPKKTTTICRFSLYLSLFLLLAIIMINTSRRNSSAGGILWHKSRNGGVIASWGVAAAAAAVGGKEDEEEKGRGASLVGECVGSASPQNEEELFCNNEQQSSGEDQGEEGTTERTHQFEERDGGEGGYQYTYYYGGTTAENPAELVAGVDKEEQMETRSAATDQEEQSTTSTQSTAADQGQNQKEPPNIVGAQEMDATTTTTFPIPPRLPTKNPPPPASSTTSTTAAEEQQQQQQQQQPPPAHNNHNHNHNHNNNDDAIPVIMIPSFAGTRLRNWNPVDCAAATGSPIHTPLSYWKVGGSVWLDIKRLLTQTTCWIQCLQLQPETQQDGLCVARPDEGLDAITQVDEQLPTGFLWKEAIDMLATQLGYQPSKNMLAHPYDWRLPPLRMEQRDRTFSRLKLKIERISLEYEDRNPNSPLRGRGLCLVGFSMGNLVLQYFFEWLEYELGRKNMEVWVDKYVYAVLMAGAPHLGAPGIVDSVLGGETVGLPITKDQSKQMYTTWGSEPWMMPLGPPKPNRRHMAMNHEESDFPLQAVKVTTQNGQILQPANADIVQKDGWFQHVLPQMQRIIDKWYGEDPLFGGGSQDDDDGDDDDDDDDDNGYRTNKDSTKTNTKKSKKTRSKPLRKPWKPPKGIDHVICSYGVNVETTLRSEYEEDPYYSGYFRKAQQVVNHRGNIYAKKDGKRQGRRLAQRKSGDGSVPYFSLSWCHSWFGNDAVNVTKVPANRPYEVDEIERYVNIDLLDAQQKQKVEKIPHGFNTFFTQQWTENDPQQQSAGDFMMIPRQKSRQVWEFEGLTHRDSVTHPLFLRILANLLQEAVQFSRKYVAVRERVMRMVWEEMMTEEESTAPPSNDKKNSRRRTSLNGVGWLNEISLEGANTIKYPASSDDDCLWDYAMVRCARPRYCEYRYHIGDVHLSQSCRLRDKPLALDDPILLLQDAEAYNVSYFVGPDRVEWQTIYRPQDPGMLPPWVPITCAFAAGALALALLLYLAVRAYGVDRLFGNHNNRDNNNSSSSNNNNNARNTPTTADEE